MNKIIKNNWFTLVELVVSIVLSSIVFLFIMNFVFKTFTEISYSKNKVNIISQIYEFENTIKNIREEYRSGAILIDNPSGTGSDILLFRQNQININDWYIFAIIDNKSLTIDWNNNINNIGDKVLAYKKVSTLEMNLLTNDINNVYSFVFNRDKVFEKIKLMDFQLTSYNAWALFEFKLLINPFYKKSLDWKKYSEIWTLKIEEFILYF